MIFPFAVGFIGMALLGSHKITSIAYTEGRIISAPVDLVREKIFDPTFIDSLNVPSFYPTHFLSLPLASTLDGAKFDVEDPEILQHIPKGYTDHMQVIANNRTHVIIREGHLWRRLQTMTYTFSFRDAVFDGQDATVLEAEQRWNGATMLWALHTFGKENSTMIQWLGLNSVKPYWKRESFDVFADHVQRLWREQGPKSLKTAAVAAQ